MMVGMQSREEKDVKTLTIARALAVLVVVPAVAGVALYVAGRLGVDGLDAGFRVAVGVAALLAVLVLVRDRRA
jgi:hypothetical protein